MNSKLRLRVLDKFYSFILLHFEGLNREKEPRENFKQSQKYNFNAKQEQSQPIQILRKGAANNENSYSQVLKNTGHNNVNQFARGDQRQSRNNQQRFGNQKPNNMNNVNQSSKRGPRKDFGKAPQQRQAPLEIPTEAIAGMTINSIPPPSVPIATDSSDFLRQILGISGGFSETRAEISEFKKLPETTPIDLNEMFKRSAKNGPATDFMAGLPVALPPPPLEWRKDINKGKPIEQSEIAKSLVPVKGSGRSAIVQQPSAPLIGQMPGYHAAPIQVPFMPPFHPHPAQHPPQGFPQHQQPFKNVMVHNQPYPHPQSMGQHPPVPHQHRNIPPFANQVKTNFFGKHKLPPAFPNQHQQVSAQNQNHSFGQQRQQRGNGNQHGPNGPQNLSNNSKHKPGHGAFIPLQAARKNVKPKAAPVNQEKPHVAITKVCQPQLDIVKVCERWSK